MKRPSAATMALAARADKEGAVTEMGEAMRAARKAAGLSQTQLAERSGTNQSIIAHWELGYTMPNLSSAINVCDVLGISIDEYIGRTPRKKER